jgi:DNA-binding GntR family transcriptional regulator
MTLQKALDVLRSEGLVMSRQGEGTIIVKKPEAHTGEELGSPHKLRALLEQMSGVLNDLSQRVSAVEAEVFGPASEGDPRPESIDR